MERPYHTCLLHGHSTDGPKDPCAAHGKFAKSAWSPSTDQLMALLVNVPFAFVGLFMNVPWNAHGTFDQRQKRGWKLTEMYVGSFVVFLGSDISGVFFASSTSPLPRAAVEPTFVFLRTSYICLGRCSVHVFTIILRSSCGHVMAPLHFPLCFPVAVRFPLHSICPMSTALHFFAAKPSFSVLHLPVASLFRRQDATRRPELVRQRKS